MQNINKKASILLWAIMLSIIIAISFISISSKVNMSIQSSSKTLNYFKNNETIKNSLYNKQNTQISENTAIIFEDTQNIVFSLKKDEQYETSFSGITDFNIYLGIIEGGGVLYTYSNGGTISHSGVLNYSQNFSGTLSPTYSTGSLTLKNLGGYSKIIINSEKDFVSTEKKYKILKSVGNQTLIEGRGSVSN